MKNKFKHYLKYSETELKTLWNESIFVVDTNILLNLYRYTDETKDKFIKILEGFKDRIWITSHSAQEYFNNRILVISDQENEYDKLLKSLNNEIKNPLNNKRRPPHISEETSKKFFEIIENVENELISTKNTISNKIHDDKILVQILSIFDKRVSEEFNDEQLNKIYKEGEERYTKKIPPGFADNKKGGIEKYGDLIIWKQMIELSKKLEKDVIFVSDDKKEDWWLSNNGKTIMPHPLLVKEFYDETKKKFHIYTAENFMRFGSNFLHQIIDNNVFEEVKDVREIISTMHKKYLNDDEANNIIVVDISDFTCKKEDVVAYLYSRFKDLNHLTDCVFFDLLNRGVKIDSYTYGYEWVLINERNNEIIKNARMITNAEKGKSLPDLRNLNEVNIYLGDKLKVLKIEVEGRPKPELNGLKEFLDKLKEE